MYTIVGTYIYPCGFTRADESGEDECQKTRV